MAGSKNNAKRGQLKRTLKTEKGQGESDREVAKRFNCSRALVKAVRSELIAQGLHPPVTNDAWTGRDSYRPGMVARGGYVYDENGKVIRETIWKKRQKAKDQSR